VINYTKSAYLVAFVDALTQHFDGCVQVDMQVRRIDFTDCVVMHLRVVLLDC